MKKAILTVACIMVAALIISCGNKANDKGKKLDQGKASEKIMKEASDKRSLEAVQIYFDKLGVNVDDIKPDFDYEMNESKCCYGETTRAAISFIKPEGQKLTADEFYAWLHKIYNATSAASPKGVVKGFHDSNKSGTKDEALQPNPKNLEEMITDSKKYLVYMWGWTTVAGDKFIKISPNYEEGNGAEKKAWVRLEVYDDLQQSWSDAEKMLEDHSDEIEKALKNS